MVVVTVIFLPAVTVVPRPVITFLPASVMLDKSFFATPLIVAVVLGTTLPLPSEYNIVTSPFVSGVYSIGVICSSLFFKSATVLFKSFTLTAALGLFVAATFKRSVNVGVVLPATPWFSMTDPTFLNTVGVVVSVFPVAGLVFTRLACTFVTGLSLPATGFSVV